MTTEKIKQLVEEELGYNIDVKSRKRKIVYGRAIYFKICKDRTNLSLYEIGQTLNLNHATVIHSLKNVFTSFKLYNPEYLTIYKRIIDRDEYIPLETRYDLLKQEYTELEDKYEQLKEVEVSNNYKSLVDIIKEIPEQQLDVANFRIDAMVKMLKTY
jgi:hypothetical protein